MRSSTSGDVVKPYQVRENARILQETYEVAHSCAVHPMLARCNAATAATMDSRQLDALGNRDAIHASRTMTVHLDRTAQRLKELRDATAGGRVPSSGGRTHLLIARPDCCVLCSTGGLVI